MTDEIPPEKNDIMEAQGKVFIRKERKKRRRLLLWELLYEFSRSTTLHGLRYVTEQGLSIMEKVFWFITFVSSMCMCFFVIYSVYEKWRANPVIITISEDLVPVTSIPFPSITICPQTKSKLSVYNFQYHHNLVKNMQQNWFSSFGNWNAPPWLIKYLDLTIICQNDIVNDNFLDELAEKTPRDVGLIHNLYEVAEPLNDFFLFCAYRNIEINCSQEFKRVWTREGLCYTFNSFTGTILNLDKVQNNYTYVEGGHISNDWHPYYGYVTGNPYTYPRRGRIYGDNSDFDIILRRNMTEKGEACNTLFDGYKVYLHHPADLPKSSLNFYAAPDGESVNLAIKCNIVNTTFKLLQKPVEERKCYFEGERKLKYFKMYTTNNCMMECLANYTYYECGCVGFYMPHNDSNHICGLNYLPCMLTAENQLADIEGSIGPLPENVQRCNCLPPCYTIEYEAEPIRSNFNMKQMLNYRPFISDSPEFQFTRLTAFFQKSSFMSMRRSEIFGWTDFVANCGGLLGLFLGFSVLSIVEIIYFVTMRLWCTLRSDLKQEKKKEKIVTIAT